MQQQAPDLLLWMDLETDQLTPAGGSILEVAAYVTDTDLNLLHNEGYHAVVHHSYEEVADLKSRAHPKVLEMHTTTGLWSQLPVSTLTLADVEKQLLAYIKEYAPQQRQIRIAGSSIRFDLNWTEEHMPLVYEHLHYRSLDVSAFVAAHQWWELPYDSVFGEVESSPHVARLDILNSLNEMRAIRRAMITGAGR